MEHSFEHHETISYVNNSCIIRHNLVDNTFSTYYLLYIDPYHREPFQDSDATFLAAIGKSTLIVAFSVNIIQVTKSWCNIILINENGKEIATKKYKMGTRTSPIKTFNIREVTNSKIKELKELKNQFDKKKLQDQCTFLEDQKLKKTYFNDLFSSPINCDNTEIKRIDNDIYITLDGETSILPANAYFRHDSINMAAYDQFDKHIIMCDTHDYIVIFQRWIKHGKTWQKIGVSSLHAFLEDPVSKIPRLQVFHKIICSRNYLCIASVDVNGDHVIVVLKKNLLHEPFTEICRIRGCHPVYHDDYQLWSQKGLQILQSEDVLKNMSHDILKIILSFV
jgi:hypothetical protein